MPERSSRGVLTELITVKPGDRVSSNGAVGTVEYVGVVEPFTGELYPTVSFTWFNWYIFRAVARNRLGSVESRQT